MERASQHWPLVTLLILNWNGKELLATCLPPLLDQDYPRYQIMVIDNGSEDGSIDYLQQQFPAVAILDNGENLGFSGGFNAGIQQARGDIVILLNNDVAVLGNDWLRQLTAPLVSDPATGVAGCKLYFPDGKTLQHAGAALTYPLAYSEHLGHLQEDAGQFNEQTDVDYITGAVMAVRRELFATIGLLDESFSLGYFEEVDFCYRARAAGFRILYVPEAAAIHNESASFGQLRERRQVAFHRNRLRFIFKHYSDAQILDDFVPAEEERITLQATPGELHILRQVFMEFLLALPQLLAARGDKRRLVDFRSALLQLRACTLVRQLADVPPASEDPLAAELVARQRFEEPSFVSGVPLFGPAIAAFRESWNSVAARWYVQLVMEQQQAFNRVVVQLLEAQLRARDEVRTNAADLDSVVRALFAWQETTQTAVGELMKRLETLDERISRLEGEEE